MKEMTTLTPLNYVIGGITGDVYRFCPLVDYGQSAYILTLTPFFKDS